MLLHRSWLVLATCLLLVSAAFAQTENAQTEAARTEAPHTVILKLRPGTTLSEVVGANAHAVRVFPMLGRNRAQSLSTEGLERIWIVTLGPGISPDSLSKVLSKQPQVEYAEPNYIDHIDDISAVNDSLLAAQWYLENIHATDAWKETTGDSTIHIGFVDTGVQWDHPDLVGQFAINPAEDINHNGLFDAWPSTEKRKDAHGNLVTGDLDGIDEDGNGVADDVIGYDFVDQAITNFGDWSGRDPIPTDEEGHGTAIAGILAARANNGIGIAGVAPGCKLVALRAFDATGNGEDDDIAAAIVYAADNGVAVLNLSFGDTYPSLLQRDALRYARRHGVVIFASSGNNGGDGPHYPSDFDEVISVGGTTNNPSPDGLYSFTTHGAAMDFVAPGDGIETLQLGGGYASVSGTSASAPMGAAAAALLLSKRPGLSADAIRGILCSSAQDILTPGYDVYSAHGRLDIKQALDFPGAAVASISSLHTMDELRSDSIVVLNGSALSTLFTNYSLSYKHGNSADPSEADSDWTTIATNGQQVVDSVLGTWNTSGLADGLYTVRLAVSTSDRRVLEDRRVIQIVSVPPQFVSASVEPIYIHEKRGALIQAVASLPTRLLVHALTSGVWLQDHRLVLEHRLLFDRSQLSETPSQTFELVLITENGDTTERTITATIPNDAVPEVGFEEKPYTLPPGFAVDSVLSDPHLGALVAESPFPDGSNFGAPKVYAFDGTKFSIVDSLDAIEIPRAIGNTQGTTTPELLTQAINATTVYAPSAGHSLFGSTLFHSDAMWGSTLADVDGDGKADIIGYNDTTVLVQASIDGEPISYDSTFSRYLAYRWNGSAYERMGTMPNTSPASVYNPFNRFTEPNVGHADLNGDGAEDIVALDNDADLLVFTFDKSTNQFRTAFEESNDGEAEGSLVTVGDFDGDGKPDIAYAFHSLQGTDTLGEYPQSYWTLRVLHNDGDFKFHLQLEEHIANARPLLPYRSSVRAVRNVTGHRGDDLVLSLFPDLYLFDYDTASNSFVPVWHYPISLSPNGALAYDFDHNGKRELGFVAGDSIRFFERDNAFADRTPAPSGLIVTPRDTALVELQWSVTDPTADSYLILRAAPGDASYTVEDSTSATSYHDTDVANGEEWDYAVVAHDARYSTPWSLPSYPQHALIHPTPRIAHAESDGQSITAGTTWPLATAALSGGEFVVDDSLIPRSAIIANDTTIVITLSLAAGTHDIRVTGSSLRDNDGSPFDTTAATTFTVAQAPPPSPFYLVAWQFQTADGVTTAHLEFNCTPSDDVLDGSNYTLSPYGGVRRIYRDTLNASAVYVELTPNVSFRALGQPFVLCVNGVHDLQETLLESSNANCAGVSFAEQDLSHAFVYPNPAHRSDGQLTFAGLTPDADIRIYSLAMRPIRHLHTTARQGGVEWDMRDDYGRLVPSGEYLFSVTGTNDDGQSVATQVQKFTIVRDE